MNNLDPLAALRPLHAPPAISWWPPAPGWWLLLAALAILGTAVLIYRRIRSLRLLRRTVLAELEAIRTALMKLKRRNLPVRIYTDSRYAQGVLSLGWKAQKNKELVEAIRELLSALKDVTLIKVRGHSGHAQNERADQLARAAIVSGGRR